jgi:hypothetical protein
MEYEIGSPGKAYTKWAAEMAVGLRTGVPWVMCKQDDAPDPIVSDLLIFILPFSDIFLPLLSFSSSNSRWFLTSLVGLPFNCVFPFSWSWMR